MKSTLGCEISKECYITIFKLLVGILFLIFVFLSGYQIYISHLSSYDCSSTVSETLSYQELIENRLSEFINVSIDPCSNFYEFACGNWMNSHDIPNHSFYVSSSTVLRMEMLRKIKIHLKRSDSQHEPEAVHEARKLYKSCVNPKTTDADLEFQEISKILRTLQLPIVPDFSKEIKKFSWVTPTVLNKKLLNHDFFFQFSIRPDPYIINENAIYIANPSSHSQSNFEKNYVLFDSPQNIFYKFLKDVTTYMYEKSNRTWDTHVDSVFNNRFFKLTEFAKRVEELDNMNSGSYLGEYMSIDDLQQMTDKIFKEFKDNSEVSHANNSDSGAQNNIFGIFSNIFSKKNTFSQINWEAYLREMFNESSVQFDLQNDDKVILVPDKLYLEEIFKLLAQTPSHILEFYMWWKTMFILLPFPNNYLAERYNQYFVQFFDRQPLPRNMYCTELVNDAFDYASSYFITNSYTMKQKIYKVSEIFENVRSAFDDELKRSAWLDEKTRIAALKKLDSIKANIGYPKWMNDSQQLDKYYDMVNMDEKDFIQNILKVKKRDFERMLGTYKIRNDHEKDNPWIGQVLQVNAFYYSFYNNIVIPAGLLYYPFYDFAMEAMNYGAIGMIIGHELTHGFDRAGKKFDDEGHLRTWWSNNTEIEYERRAQCFIDYYNQYNSDIKANSNGRFTLNENLADHGGLKIAFKAYTNYLKEQGLEEVSTSLNYTSEQLFFLAFAQGRCERISEQLISLRLDNKYGPNQVRVISTLRNSEEFAKAWQCKEGSPMNPDVKKCQLW